MIIFVIRNKLSNEFFVGLTGNDLQNQWNTILCATKKNLDYPLYNSIKKYGENAFEIQEWDYAETRKELIILEKEAIKLFNAKSLRGYKTSNFNVKKLTNTKKNCQNIENIYTDDNYSDEPNILKSKQIDHTILDYYDDQNIQEEEPLLEEDLKYIDKQLHTTNLTHNKDAQTNNHKSNVKKTVPIDIKISNIQQNNIETVKQIQSTATKINTETSIEKTNELNEDQINFMFAVKQALSKHKRIMNITNKEEDIARLNNLKFILHRLNERACN